MKMIPQESQQFAPSDQQTEDLDRQRLLPEIFTPGVKDFGTKGGARYDVISSGDTVTTNGFQQSLALVSGETISVDQSGRIQMFDRVGNPLKLESKSMTPPGQYPELLLGEYRGGIQTTNAGGHTFVNYPDGTSVHIEDGKIRSVRRGGQTFSIGEPDDFGGFK